jgi:hypothetical protein
VEFATAVHRLRQGTAFAFGKAAALRRERVHSLFTAARQAITRRGRTGRASVGTLRACRAL